MEISRLTLPQETTGAKIKSQDNFDLFLWLQRDSAPRVCPTWSDCQPEVLSPSSGTSETVVLSCEARIVPHQADPAPWQYTLTHSDFFCPGVFGKNIDSGPISPHLLTRSHSMWLLLPCHEESIQGITFWNHVRDSEGYDSHSKQLAGEWLLEVLWQLETMLEFMYSCRRDLLWRRLRRWLSHTVPSLALH
jgi:hypothetical protein